MRYEMIDNIVLLKVLDQYMIVLAMGENGPVPYTNTVNETGAFYFNLLKEGKSVDEMVEMAVLTYETSKEEVEPGLMKFLDLFEKIGYIRRV